MAVAPASGSSIWLDEVYYIDDIHSWPFWQPDYFDSSGAETIRWW